MKAKNIAQKNAPQRGFTLIEILMTVAVLAILATVALPAVDGYTEKRRIIGAAEEIYSQISYARSEAIKQSAIIYVRPVLTGASPSATWDIGISTTSGCDPTAGGAANCLVSGAEKVTRSTVFPGVSMTTPTFPIVALIPETNFEPVRGIASAGVIDLTTTGAAPNYALRIDVNLLGRIVITSPDGSVAGY